MTMTGMILMNLKFIELINHFYKANKSPSILRICKISYLYGFTDSD